MSFRERSITIPNLRPKCSIPWRSQAVPDEILEIQNFQSNRTVSFSVFQFFFKKKAYIYMYNASAQPRTLGCPAFLLNWVQSVDKSFIWTSCCLSDLSSAVPARPTEPFSFQIGWVITALILVITRDRQRRHLSVCFQLGVCFFLAKKKTEVKLIGKGWWTLQIAPGWARPSGQNRQLAQPRSQGFSPPLPPSREKPWERGCS